MQAVSTTARRVARTRSAALKTITCARTYASPPVPIVKDEVDPQLGGYPQLPWVSKQTRPARGWDDPQMRRNFGEILHEKEEVLSMWGPDISDIPQGTALRQFTIAVLAFVGFGFVVNAALIPKRPAVPREYPYSGLVTELGGLEENKGYSKASPEDEADEE